MKTIRLFSVGFLVVSVLFPQKSHSQDYTRMSLPEGAKARLGKGSVVLGVSGAEPISQIAYSRDGTRLAVASSIGVWLYDARTGAEVALLTRYSDRFFSVAFSPDGGTLASGGQEGTLLLWDLATGQLKDSLEGHTGNVTFLAFSSNGNTLISGGQDYIRIGNNSVVTWLGPDTILLWDVASGKLKETLEGPGDGSASATYSPEGKSLASWSGVGIRLWNADSGQLKATIGGGFLAFSPDGSALATADREGIQWWDAENGQHIKTLAQHTSEFRSAAFSPDWTAVATGSWDGTIRFWDAFTGRLKATLEAHKDQVIFLDFSPDGGTLASGSSDGRIRLWDVASGHLNATLEAPTNEVKSLTISPDGRTLIGIGKSSENLRFWDAYSGQLKASIESFWTVHFPYGATLATASKEGEIRLWDADSGRLKAIFTGHTDPINSVAFAPDGITLASGSWNGTIRLWDTKSRQPRTIFGRHLARSVSISFSPDGETIASGGYNLSIPGSEHAIRLWDTDTGLLKATITGNIGPFPSLSFSPDGKILASGDRRVQLWDASSGERIAITEGSGEISSIAFSPDGKTLASGGSLVLLWNASSGERIAILEESTSISSVAFSPDGKTLAGGGRRRLLLWDVTTEQPKATLKVHDYWWGAISSVAFSPDGETLASGGREGVELWDVATNQKESILTGHTYGVSSISFSPDGRTLASGSSDGTILLWDMSPYITTPPVATSGPTNITRTEVIATVLGADVEGLAIEFSRAISGRPADYIWGGVTDAAGRLALTISSSDRSGVSGYYRARACSAGGQEVGKWNSIPLNRNRRQILELTLGGDARVVAVERLGAAKKVAPQERSAFSALDPIYPNPFNASTLIPYRLAAAGPVRLEIHNILGQSVYTLVDQFQAAGRYQVRWNGRDQLGAAVSAGVYFARLQYPGGVKTRRLLYLE